MSEAEISVATENPLMKMDMAPSGGGWSLLGAAFLAAGGLLTVNEAIFWFFRRRPPYKENFKPKKVYVFQFRRTPCIPSFSPKCLGLETWLRMAEISYEVVLDNRWLHDASTGALPFIELNGKQYSGIQTIITEVSNNFSTASLEVNVNDDVTNKTEEAIEGLMWCYFYFRCVRNEKILLSKKCIGNNPPTEPILPWTADVLFKMMVNNDSAHQLGELEGISKKITTNMKEKLENKGFKTERQIMETGFEHLKLLSTTLGGKRFLFSHQRPSATDAFMFGILAQIFYGPYKSPFKKYVKVECRNLIDHCEEIKKAFWADWNDLLKQA